MKLVQPIKDVKTINSLKQRLLSDREHGLRNHLLFVLGINSGLRISDLLKLKIVDVLDDNNKVRQSIILKEQKTKKIKQFPLNQSSISAITTYLNQLNEVDYNEYIFKSRKGQNKPISRIQAWEILKKASLSIGINESIGTHSLRKTFGYHAYQTGTDIVLLQNIFNHSAPSITLRYIGITQEDMDNVYINLNL